MHYSRKRPQLGSYCGRIPISRELRNGRPRLSSLFKSPIGGQIRPTKFCSINAQLSTMNQHQISPSYFTNSKPPYRQPVDGWTLSWPRRAVVLTDAILLCCSRGDAEEVDCQQLGRRMLFFWYALWCKHCISHDIQFKCVVLLSRPLRISCTDLLQ